MSVSNCQSLIFKEKHSAIDKAFVKYHIPRKTHSTIKGLNSSWDYLLDLVIFSTTNVNIV